MKHSPPRRTRPRNSLTVKGSIPCAPYPPRTASMSPCVAEISPSGREEPSCNESGSLKCTRFPSPSIVKLRSSASPTSGRESCHLAKTTHVLANTSSRPVVEGTDFRLECLSNRTVGDETTNVHLATRTQCDASSFPSRSANGVGCTRYLMVPAASR